jgi:hypothetical protein
MLFAIDDMRKLAWMSPRKRKLTPEQYDSLTPEDAEFWEDRDFLTPGEQERERERLAAGELRMLADGRKRLTEAVNGWWGHHFEPPWPQSWLDPDDDKGKVIAAMLGMLNAGPPQEPTVTAAAKLAGIAPATARQWRTRDPVFKAVTEHLGGYLWTYAQQCWGAYVAHHDRSWEHDV